MEQPLIREVELATIADLKRANLKSATAEDSVRNEFILHRQIHTRLADPRNHQPIDSLNHWVYANLFLMPDTDPWLGLHTPEVFTGLENNGIVGK